MAGKVTRSVEERFWEKTKKKNGCWEWLANKNKKGYGRLWVDGRNVFAHRVSWVIHRGPVIDEWHVLHRCDNPSCVNPKHLFLGTLADNIIDRCRKGRSALGERNGNSKLTIKQVLEIRSSNKSIKQIARKFKIDKTQVRNIINCFQWRHV